jgi:hypothetical protein
LPAHLTCKTPLNRSRSHNRHGQKSLHLPLNTANVRSSSLFSSAAQTPAYCLARVKIIRKDKRLNGRRSHPCHWIPFCENGACVGPVFPVDPADSLRTIRRPWQVASPILSS